mgnify:CR=1 FL=1
MQADAPRDLAALRKLLGHLLPTATELAATSRELESTASGFGASATDVAAATRQISTTGEELLHTMQAVADRVDCAVGTIYTYFNSKASLIAA